MVFTQINPYQKLSKRQLYQLFWYAKFVVNYYNPKFDYLNDFHVRESLIQQFNQANIIFYGNEELVRQYLLQYGLYDVDDTDVRNVIAALHIRYSCNYSEYDIRNMVVLYLKWINDFYFQYDNDYRFQAKPVIWDSQRRYDTYTIMQLERGALMETFVDNEFKRYGFDIGFYYDPCNQSHGENMAGIEIKHDIASEKTGNYYIEFGESLCNQNFIPSGILKRDNVMFWLIGTPKEYLIVYKESLKQLLFSMNQNKSGWQNGKKFVSNKSSRGFIVKKSLLQEIAVAHSIQEFVCKFYLRQVAA